MAQLGTLTLAALLLSTGAASAQTTFRLGVRGGLNRALTTVDPAGNADGYSLQLTTEKSFIYAWQAGAVFEANFGKFALQPALLFSQKGERAANTFTLDGIVRTAYAQASTTRANWLELPLNVVYTLHGDHGLQLFAGPYVALAVGGRQTGTTFFSSPNVRTAPQEVDNRLAYGPGTSNRRFDAGVNFGIGYRQGPVQVQLGYGLGLGNLHQATNKVYYDYGHDFDADAAHNRVAQLTGTYFFAL